MFIIEKYSDGSISYGFESDDEVISSDSVSFYDLYGQPYKTYPAGEVLTITGRGYYYYHSSRFLIPGLVEFYKINNHHPGVLSSFKPKYPEKCLPKPLEYVVHWHEGKTMKYSLVAARTAKEAKKIAFSAKYFTEERMRGIKIFKPFEKKTWQLPENVQWISVHPLN
jgi:hypothetical protein